MDNNIDFKAEHNISVVFDAIALHIHFRYYTFFLVVVVSVLYALNMIHFWFIVKRICKPIHTKLSEIRLFLVIEQFVIASVFVETLKTV